MLACALKSYTFPYTTKPVTSQPNPTTRTLFIKKDNIKNGILKLPKSVNPQENSRVKASMLDNLRLFHLQGLRHPVEESQVSPVIEIDKSAHQPITTAAGAAPLPLNVPFGEIHSVIQRLNPQQSKRKQECKGAQNVDQS